MTCRMFLLAESLALAVGILAPATPACCQAPARGSNTIVRDRVVAGSPRDFMEVRHLVLRGSNEQIGRALAEIAQERFGYKAIASPDALRTRVQRRYIEKNYPILHERMSGVAAACGRRLDDDAWNFCGLWYLFGAGAGCSVAHFPASATATGAGIVSRNYDFTTGTLRGQWSAKGELPATARPYIIEMHPTKGHASIAVYSYDLLSGVMDGINAEGLTVSLLADDELMEKFRMEPAGFDGVGLGGLQTLRMLLDTCANVDEAKEALLSTKQYYEIVPMHYLVADRHGQAFVWEYSHAHNREYIIENPGKALITTNFSLHRYLDGKNPPSAAKVKDVCPRYCELALRLAKQPGKLTVDAIKEHHRAIDMVKPSPNPARAPTRTLWHALYFPAERKVQVSFYLRDEASSEASATNRIVRTPYLEFGLHK